MILYTDASTKNNGVKGYQVTTIVVTDKTGVPVFEKKIGDYTVNEGEVLGILAALKLIKPDEPKTIYSDSRIAVNWINLGYKKKNTATRRCLKFIDAAQILKNKTESEVFWVKRDKNLAGLYFEELLLGLPDKPKTFEQKIARWKLVCADCAKLYQLVTNRDNYYEFCGFCHRQTVCFSQMSEDSEYDQWSDMVRDVMGGQYI